MSYQKSKHDFRDINLSHVSPEVLKKINDGIDRSRNKISERGDAITTKNIATMNKHESKTVKTGIIGAVTFIGIGASVLASAPAAAPALMSAYFAVSAATLAKMVYHVALNARASNKLPVNLSEQLESAATTILKEKEQKPWDTIKDFIKSRFQDTTKTSDIESRVNAFQTMDRDSALKKHPELSTAYYAIDTTKKIMASRGINPESNTGKAILHDFSSKMSEKMRDGVLNKPMQVERQPSPQQQVIPDRTPEKALER